MKQFSSNISKKGKILGIGLSSGTSADGIDGALVEINQFSEKLEINLIEYIEIPYLPDLSKEIKEIASGKMVRISEILKLNYLLGELFADAVMNLLKNSKFEMDDVDFIGSHGQTICHLSEAENYFGRDINGTMQVGDGAIIAKRTEVLTLSDFRVDDTAVGGDGAPLLPYVDYILFRSDEKSRLIQNIGGIANLCYLPARCKEENVIAFDTGPGNMVIDSICSILTDGEKTFDDCGEFAINGQINEKLLDELLDNDYFHKKPPKSCGRLQFGSEYAMSFVEKVRKSGLNNNDIIATVSMLTVESIIRAYKTFIFNEGKTIDEILLSGGGAKNKFLVDHLIKKLPEETKVMSINDFGLSVESREAVSFALLGYLTLKGRECNLIDATGASRRVILGKVSFP